MELVALKMADGADVIAEVNKKGHGKRTIKNALTIGMTPNGPGLIPYFQMLKEDLEIAWPENISFSFREEDIADALIQLYKEKFGTFTVPKKPSLIV